MPPAGRTLGRWQVGAIAATFDALRTVIASAPAGEVVPLVGTARSG